MNDTCNNGDAAISSRLILDADRMNAVDKLFGIKYVLKLEPTVFRFAEQLAAEYTGGYWQFYALSNGGFYMAPRLDMVFAVSCDNGFDGHMTADALGIVVCLYTYSNLSFGDDVFAETCANHYHWLREYAMDHAEVRSILRAID